MTKVRFLTLFSCILFLVSCRTNSEEVVLKGSEYFPMKIGDIRFYDVDTVIFDYFNLSIDTISHIIKEEVVEKYTDQTNDTVYRITLSTYIASKFDWVVFKSFERKIKDNYALEKMENKTEVKMLFPIANYKTKGTSYTWNANMFNTNEPLSVKYTSVFTSFHNGINPYNNCVSVKMSKPLNNGILIRIKEEVYAKEIGLVYRFTDSTDYLLGSSFPSGKQVFIRLKN